jgi:hypothetical protein
MVKLPIAQEGRKRIIEVVEKKEEQRRKWAETITKAPLPSPPPNATAWES